jgi:Dehydratase family/D-isomer specific 2-hydroxyacid dehydrogenase, NAD binding domain
MATDQTPAPIDRKRLRSQRLREVNFQGDALRLGMNWTEDDLGKPQVLVESAYGMGHPGTFHFRSLVEEVSNGVFEVGGKPAEFVVSDICDGVVQATDGMSYSLISRDIIAAMIEIHALGHPHDAMMLISGNDKSVPAHLLAIARCDLPAVHVPGGTQLNAPDYVTSNQMWEMGAAVRRGELTEDELELAQRGACPTCGACQFMGSASTGQVLSEGLGLALPGSALVPEPLTKLLRYARAAGKQILRLLAEDLTPRRILTREAFLSAEEITAAGVKGVSFDELVTESDCLVIQAPLTEETHHLFDEAQLRRMKSSAILINTARGPIVDDRALYRALHEGWIAGAGLDDIEEEPAKVRDWRADNPLFGLDNVIITPHAAYYSEESIGTVRRFGAQEVVRVLTGQAPLSSVNAGELVEARWSRAAGA